MPYPIRVATGDQPIPSQPSQTAASSVTTTRATIAGLGTGTGYSSSPFGAYIQYTPTQDELLLVGGSLWGVTASDAATTHEVTVVVSFTFPNGQAYTYQALFPTLGGKTKLDLKLAVAGGSSLYAANSLICARAGTLVTVQVKEIVDDTQTTGVYGANLTIIRV